MLRQRDDIFLIPDVLCNAGGVIVSYFEWVQGLQSFFWTEAEVNDKLYRQLELAYQQVLQMAKKQKLYMRDAALPHSASARSPRPSKFADFFPEEMRWILRLT